MQEPIYKTNALASSCSDQSPILFVLYVIIRLKKTKGERVYINLIKLYIKRKISSSHEKSHSNHRSFSKQRKYIQTKYIHFSVSEAKKTNEEMNTVEMKMKNFEENLTNNESKCKRN